MILARTQEAFQANGEPGIERGLKANFTRLCTVFLYRRPAVGHYNRLSGHLDLMEPEEWGTTDHPASYRMELAFSFRTCKGA